MVAALRKLGFDYVFDTNFSADLNSGRGSELLERVKRRRKVPDVYFMLPGLGNMMEKIIPEFTENLSKAEISQG